MLPISYTRCLLLVLLFASCVLISYGKGGRGGGGSRGGGRSSGGGWGRSSSSRSSSSGSSSSYSKSSSSPSKSSSSYDSSSSLGSGASFSFKQPSSSSVKDHASISGSATRGIQSANYPRQQYYQKPSAPSETSLFQGLPNGNYPRQPISSNTFASSHSSFPEVGIANANYPRQPISVNPFMSPQSISSQGGISSANYPRQTISSNSFSSNPFLSHSSIPKVGIQNANYPRQPISSNHMLPSHSSLQQGGIPNYNYPRQPISSNPVIPLQSSSSQRIIPNANYPRLTPKPFGSSQPQGLPTVNFPRQVITPNLAIPRERSTIQVQPSRTTSFYNRPPNSFPNTNYPRQPHMPRQILGSGVWNPKSGMPAPVYMNYGGLPTGANMHTKPLKKKGFLGSLISLGSSGKPYKNKHYASYPSPYGMGGGKPSDVLRGFMGNKGSKTAMYTILPYMAARKAPKIFKPKFRFYNYRPIHYHSYGYQSHLHDTEYANVGYDVYNNDYVGRCNRPIKPDHAKIVCNSTHNQVDCGITCEEGYRYPDTTTTKTNKCWHATGVWSPIKNFPACEPVCKETCLNGGKCASPGGVCRCPSEYRGPHCEFHFLNCDIHKFAEGLKVRWVCIHTHNETSCLVKCKSPAQFATPSETTYKCTPQGVWTPSSMPVCGKHDSEASTGVGETREISTAAAPQKQRR